ncbi:hypothetical protein [uncultured Thiodictyon sp.]|uniref:hypothetical protein n=1 Tax=uncultured Thiodictyon sp. TaxID=1846217 RepID=UPI0025E52460|nr:hypothetical protein [uncultured Thiodictyon sp.]
MTKIVKLASLSAAALIGATLIGGCADQTARDTAQQALDKANAAQQCCDTNTASLDALRQKAFRK